MLQRVLDRLLGSVTIQDAHPLVPFVMLDAPFASQNRLQALASIGALVNSSLAERLDRILRRLDNLQPVKDDAGLWKPVPDTVSSLELTSVLSS